MKRKIAVIGLGYVGLPVAAAGLVGGHCSGVDPYYLAGFTVFRL